MSRALEEATRGVGRTAPNPPVGAVVVRDGVELGCGWHRQAGEPHAEREAIADVTRRHGEEAMKGATIYVTLEPCSTSGRTPPCVDGVIEAGFRKVVYALRDPNPDHAGRADGLLESRGIEVVSGVMEEEAGKLIRPFARVQKTGLPWVVLKTAMSLDGRLTRPVGEGMWLTGGEAREEVQRMRSQADAMITSGETVRRDLPRLDIRVPELLEGRKQPWRVVLTDRPETLPEDAPLFVDAHKDRTLVRSGKDPEAVLRELVSEKGVNQVMVECGGQLAGVLLDLGLVDELAVFLAPMLTGGDVPSIGGAGFAEGLDLNEVSFDRFGPDVMMRAVVGDR